MKKIPAYILRTIKIALPLAVVVGALGGGAYAEWTAQQSPAVAPITTVTIPDSTTEVTPVQTPDPHASAPPTSGSSQPADAASPPNTVTPPAPSGGANGLTPQTSTPAAQTSPTPVVLSQTDYTSTNWAGYLSAVAGASYTSVSGGWTIPQATGQIGTTSADAAWVGIGGVTSNDLIQVGTENQVAPNGQLLSAAFYEILPASAVVIPSMTVNAGDTISASINETGANVFTISMSDVTNGSNFSTTVNYTSTNSSAEWIEEDPSYTSRQLVPFDVFGTINFTGARTTMNGVSQNLVATTPRSIALTSGAGGRVLALPTSIGTDGASFSVVQQ